MTNSFESAEEASQSGVGRRTAIKGFAGVATGAVVWAGPTIKGLARRPAYAAVGSAGGEVKYGEVDALGFSQDDVGLLSKWELPNGAIVTYDANTDTLTVDETVTVDGITCRCRFDSAFFTQAGVVSGAMVTDLSPGGDPAGRHTRVAAGQLTWVVVCEA